MTGTPEKKMTVTKHNDLVTASYSLNLAEQRLIMAAASKINPRTPMPKVLSVSAKDYSEIYKLAQNQCYTQLKEATQHLWGAEIAIIEGAGRSKALRMIRWVQECKYVDGEGRVDLVFSDSIRPYLSKLHSHVTSYDLWRAARLTSAYSLRLFEMLMQFKSTGWLYISLDALRTRLMLGDSYKRFNNLRQRVIDPAVEELEEKSGLKIDIEWIREGRSTVAMKLTFVDLVKSPIPVEVLDEEEGIEPEALDAEYQEEQEDVLAITPASGIDGQPTRDLFGDD